MAWKFRSDQPIWLQTADRIKQRIFTGEYPPGGRVPPVRELSQEAGINPNTVQRALAHLEQEGLVCTRSTTGRTVTEDTAAIAALRQQIARELIRQCCQGLEELGYRPEDMAELLSTAWKEDKEVYQ